MARRRDTTPAPSPVLDAAVEATRAITSAEAARFELAVQWAEAHPAPVEDDVVDECGILQMYGDQPVTLAGEGAPGMSEFAITEFAVACGMSSYAGRAFIGAALECKYRLPRIWARVMAGEVQVWKARRVTERTHRLTMAGAAYVDNELAHILETCSFAQIEKTAQTAAAEADPEHVEEGRAEDYESQHLQVRFDRADPGTGLIPVQGLLDYPDALAFESALKTGAEQLRHAHPELSLDMRRAMATGRLGGDDLSLPAREVVVYAHFNPTDAHGIVDIERLGHTTIEQVSSWCVRAGTKVTIRPVLDLDTEITVDRYRPSEELREQVILTLPTCIFPGCGRSARSCDLDHVVAYDDGGGTNSWNLAPLCRLHHRMKTFGYWTYTRTSWTEFEWTSQTTGRIHHVDLTYTRRRTR